MAETPFKCGLEPVLEILSGKWKPLILYHVASGPKRTGQLRRLVTNVSEKMLVQHLKEMTRDGIIKRNDFKTVPPHVEYELTAFGQGLAQVLSHLCAWGTEHADDIARILRDRNNTRGAA